MRKNFMVLCSVALVLIMAGCSKTDIDEKTTDIVNESYQEEQQTVYGLVSAVDGTKVTLLIGEMGQGQQFGEVPGVGEGQLRGFIGGFVTGTETVEYDLANAQIMLDSMGETDSGSMEDIKEGSILKVILNNNTVITVTEGLWVTRDLVLTAICKRNSGKYSG